MKKSTLAILVAAVLLILAFGVIAIAKSERNEESARYNNGICLECGGHLEQSGTWVDRADGAEFNVFHCDKCGQRELFRFFGK